MADTRGIKAGRAYVVLGVADKLTAGLKRAQARLRAFGVSMTSWGKKIFLAGAAMAVPFVMSIKNFARVGDAIAKMSRRTGVSVEALSELAYAAELSGTSMEGLENGLRRMQRTIYDAGRELSTAVDGLADLGLSFKQLDGMAPEDQFAVFTEALSRIEDPSRRAAIAMTLLGRSGTALLPMMEQGAAGLEEMRKKARDLGLSMSKEDAAAAERLTDAFTAMLGVIKKVAFAIGAALAPQLSSITEMAATWTSQAIDWIKQNRGLIISIAKLTVGVIAFGAALVVTGHAITLFSTLIGVAATVLPLLLSPIGAVILAVGLLGAYMLTATKAGGKALDWLGGKFSGLQDDATEAYRGISDAMVAGDIGLAAKILWLTLKLEWTRGVAAISTIWNDAMLWFKDTFAQAGGGLRQIWESITHWLTVTNIVVTSAMEDAWWGFVNGVLTAWHWVAKELAKAWNWLKGLFDESFDVETANKAAQDRYNQMKADLDTGQALRLKAIKEENVAALAGEKLLHKQKQSDIAFETLARRQALKTEHDANIKAAEAGLDAAKKAFKEARKMAGEARKATEDLGPGELEGPEALLDRIGDAAGALGRAGPRGITAMSMAAMQSLQAAPAIDRVAVATEQTAKNTRKLPDLVVPKFR